MRMASVLIPWAHARPANIDAISAADLKALVVELLDRVAALSRVVAQQREEIARFKGLKGRPDIKANGPSSGMEQASRAVEPSKAGRRGGSPPAEYRGLAAAPLNAGARLGNSARDRRLRGSARLGGRSGRW